MRLNHLVIPLAAGLLLAVQPGNATPRSARKVTRGLAESGAVRARAAVVVFQPGVSAADADKALSTLGIVRIEHPDLLPSQRLVRVTGRQMEEIASLSEVARIFPASRDLDTGRPVHACDGAMIEQSKAVALRTSLSGEGWSRNLAGVTELTWSLRNVPDYLPAAETAASLERALGEWARYAALKFTRTSQSRAPRNIEFLFGAGDHGDPYPFQGRNGVLAHGFYPAGINPEPIAGDIHLNADETWSIGGSTDVYSIALHEVGHALGLGHSESPGAVMYPYYTGFSALQADDIDALLRLYPPAPVVSTQPEAGPESLSITAGTPRWVSESAVEVTGTVSGGSGGVSVAWSTGVFSGSVDGRNWTIFVPVGSAGATISLTATDESGAKASVSMNVLRDQPAETPEVPFIPPFTPASPTPASDRLAPTVRISSPAGAVISTTAQRIRIAGTARDNTGVQEVTWSRSDLSGAASGTSSWSFEVPLMSGENYVVITARDAAGNTGRATVMITRH